MSYIGHIPPSEDWLSQLFSAKAVEQGGVVRRKVRDVERKIGRSRLELEVKRRGFRMIQAGDQLIVVCNREPIRVVI